MPVGEFVCVW